MAGSGCAVRVWRIAPVPAPRLLREPAGRPPDGALAELMRPFFLLSICSCRQAMRIFPICLRIAAQRYRPVACGRFHVSVMLRVHLSHLVQLPVSLNLVQTRRERVLSTTEFTRPSKCSCQGTQGVMLWWCRGLH